MPKLADPENFGGAAETGRALFGDYLLAFELTSVLVVAAMVGVLVIAGGKGPSMEITVSHYAVLASMLFATGVYGVLTRKNILVVLMSIRAHAQFLQPALLVAFSRLHEGAAGHVFVLMAITVAAAEVAVGLAFVVSVYRQRRSLDVDLLRILRG